MTGVFAETVTIILRNGLSDVLAVMPKYDIPLETEKITICYRGYENQTFGISNGMEKRGNEIFYEYS